MKTKKSSNRLLALLVVFALFFCNVRITSAAEAVAGSSSTVDTVNAEIANATTGSALNVVDSTSIDEDALDAFVDVNTSEDAEVIPAGVWSDEEPYFTDEVPAVTETAGQPSRRMARSVGITPTYQEAYASMVALQETYPEGTYWTNFQPYGENGSAGKYYIFQGGAVKGAQFGVGCAAFVFNLSDKAFGSLPARTIDSGNFVYEDIKVGDILRINNSHFVIVLKISEGGLIVAEGNYNKSVHWGRAISKNDIMATANFLVTRYPVGYTEDTNADEIAHSGNEGSIAWTITNNGVLTISGTGDMPNYTSDNGPAWNKAEYNISCIIIEDGITGIGDYAFYGNSTLVVHIPDSVTKIGSGAFQGSNITSVTIPSATINVDAEAFRSCENLTSVSIPEGCQTIGDNAFRGCTSLTHLDFPASVTSIGAGAFTSCSKVTQIRFVPSTQEVTIGDDAFAQCWYLSSVTLPYGLTKISNNLFQSCTALGQIYISSKVTSIGENPFLSTMIQYGGTISFGGSEATWKSIGGQFILNSMPNANIEYNVEFEDPFAADPNDPGDLIVDPDDNNGDNNVDNPGDNTDNNTGDSNGDSSGDNTGDSTDTGSGSDTDSSSGTDTDIGSNTGSSSGTDTDTGSNTGSSSGTDTDTGSNTGSSSGTDTDTGSNTGSSSGTDTDTGSNTGSSSGTDTDTGSNTGSSSGTDTDTGSNTGSSSGTGSGYGPIYSPGTSTGSGPIYNPGTSTGSGTSTNTGASTGTDTGADTVSGDSSSTTTETGSDTATDTGANSTVTDDNTAINSDDSTSETKNDDITATDKAYKPVQKVKAGVLYDSNNKKVGKYNLKKNGTLTYRGKNGKKAKPVKNVKQAGYRQSNGNLIYRVGNKVKEIDCKTLKIRTLYKKNIKKLIKEKGFVTGVKTKNGKIKTIKNAK